MRRRSWLSKNKNYSTIDNFISLNSYVGLELNAHSLIKIVLFCEEHNVLDKLFTWDVGSQSCEGFYRLLRSFTSTYNTIINFTILEAIQKIQKIQLQADILNFDFESDGETVNFPRSKFLNPSFDKIDSTSDIPEFTQPEFAELSLASLKKIMLSAQDDANSAINSLAIQTKNFK